MWLSVNKFIRITQDLIGGQILDEHRGLVYASPLRPKTSAADGTTPVRQRFASWILPATAVSTRIAS
jgi:hypothetical protein